MLADVFRKTLWDRRISILWWTAGLLVFVLINLAFYPSIRDQQSQFDALLEAYPEELLALFGVDDVTSIFEPVGYVNSQVYANVGPLLFLIFAIGAGAAATAGEERDGTLDLLLAHPVSRDRIVVSKFAALVVLVTVLAGALILLLLVANPAFGLELSLEGIVAVNVGLILLALLFGALAMALGAWTGSRGLTIGIASAVAVAAFLFFGLAPLVDAIEWTQQLSPFYWFLGDVPLRDGVPWLGYGLLAGWTGVFLAAAVALFRRRDVQA